MQDSLEQLKTSLKEMFQFQNNDLNFGIFKIYKLKQKEIESFIDNNLEIIVKKELEQVSNLEEKSSLLELELFLKGFNQEELLVDINSNYEKIDGFINLGGNGNTKKLKEILKSQRNGSIEGDLENKIYNYILNFFELYYDEGDFGYNTRSLNSYKVEYDENYNGSDIMFHWKHKGSYYIKSANGFNSVKFELQNRNIEFLLETNNESEGEEQAQNNNRETEFKHYKFNRIEKTGNNNFKVIFNLSKTSTPKEEIYKAIFSDILENNLEDNFLYSKDKKEIFKSLDKNFGKIENGNIKGFKDLKIKKDDLVKKYDTNLEAKERLKKSFDELDKNNEIEKTIITLWSLDKKLNSFYIGNDSDFFIHKDLKSFLTPEKEKFIKNNILGDLNTILNSKIDNTSLVIAKTFNEISSNIIEFLSAIEEFQKSIFESKKKVLVNEYCITLDKIKESFYSEILENKNQIKEWINLGFIEDKKVLNKEYLKENQTLNIDTKFFSQDFKDNLLSTFENLEEQTNGMLINSENFQALNLLKNKYRGKVKCIYIDPPYNTGGDGFVYKDSFKHSSWLSMMENRLTLAREFLSDDGVIFVSIDDNEQDNLKKLMDGVFGNENFVANLVWEKKNGRQNDAKYYSTNHDFIINYSKNKDKYKPNLLERTEKMLNLYKNPDNDERGLWTSITLQAKSGTQNNIFEIEFPNGIKWSPPKGTFSRFNKNKLLELYKENRLFFGENGNNTPRLKKFLSDVKEGIISNTILFNDDVSNTQKAKAEIKDLFGENIFDTPKPLKLLKYLIILSTNPNDIILDFFSGSGTTQQAVIELNKEDNKKKAGTGNRKYIGVEMGEYFDTVTKPRVQKVIYTSNWKEGKPQDKVNSEGREGTLVYNKGVSQIMKYQVLEQYEDMLDKLEIDNENFPEGLDLKYLYKKEEIKLKSTLNLRKPFENIYIYGKTKKETKIDLVETYNYLRGNNIESIKTFDIGNEKKNGEKKYYKCIKIGNILQIWRDIEVGENDLENIKEIVEKYKDIEVLELNVEIYSLERNKFGTLEINGKNYDIEIIDESLFNE